jgi:hypothetical protein
VEGARAALRRAADDEGRQVGALLSHAGSVRDGPMVAATGSP